MPLRQVLLSRKAWRLVANFAILVLVVGATARKREVSAQPPAQGLVERIATPQSQNTLPQNALPTPTAPPASPHVLQSPRASERAPAMLPQPIRDLRAGERPLPINLATALRLSNARPLVIQAAQASEMAATADYERAKAQWLPNLNIGGSYLRHDGGAQGNSGAFYDNDRNQYMAGGGVQLMVSSSDAIFMPLAARQVVQSRNFDIQTARNDAMLNVAESFFNVQQARGRLAGAEDAAQKARALVRRAEQLADGLVAPIEINRAKTTLAAMEQTASTARGAWGIASADLTRALRLDPAALVMPLEPPYMQVTLISPSESVDALIPIGLSTRPELASQRQLVQATLARLKQERMRPLMPSLMIWGAPTPAGQGGYLMGGFFASNSNGTGTTTGARNDVNAELLWGVQNMGFGNRAAIHSRQADEQQALIQMYREQDAIAADIARAHCELAAAAERVPQAEIGLRQAQISFEGNLRGVSETTRFGDLLTLVNRPSEVVVALLQLSTAYDNYFAAVNDFNRAQFRMYHALGYPSGILAFERTAALGTAQPIDPTRPYPLPPVGP
jgi:outer membrane protein TolC